MTVSRMIQQPYLPGYTSGLHVIGQRHVVAPHVELPLPQAQDAAQNVSGVYADAHVHVEPGCFPHEPKKMDQSRKLPRRSFVPSAYPINTAATIVIPPPTEGRPDDELACKRRLPLGSTQFSINLNAQIQNKKILIYYY